MLNSEKTQVYEVGWNVDKGQLRSNMQDSVAAIDMDLIDGNSVNSIGIYLVADGVAGQAQGEIASQMAIHTSIEKLIRLLTHSKQSPSMDYSDWMELVVESANEVVYRQHTKMATTLVMALLIDQKAHIANVGDSRAYLISDSGIHQITEDQSVVQQLLNSGLITPEQAVNHPYRNILTHSIGARETVKVDTYDVNLLAGNYLLLCSDGLTNELDNENIYDIVRSAQSVQAACDSLIEEANASGGRDNIAVVLIEMKNRELAEVM